MRARLRRRIRWWEMLVIILVTFVAGQLLTGGFEWDGFLTTAIGMLIAAPFLFLLDRYMQRREEAKSAPLFSRDPDDYR